MTFHELMECRDAIEAFTRSRAWEVVKDAYQQMLTEIEAELDCQPVTPERMPDENVMKGQKHTLKKMTADPFYSAAFDKQFNIVKTQI